MGQVTRYSAIVKEVHSGDDLVILASLGMDGIYKKARARLKGVDTPSAFKAPPSSDAGKIRDFVKALVKDRECCVDVHSIGKGGWLVTLIVLPGEGPNGEKIGKEVNVNELLISKGFVYRKQGTSDE